MLATRIIGLILLVLPFQPGCALQRSAVNIASEPGLVLEDTPYYPQKKYQCGPASLAMVLSASGALTDPDTLEPHTYLPGRRGSLQLELVAECRRHGRIPYVINRDIFALIAELQAGRPVLVLQNLGLNILPAYHYAVVIGVISPDGIVLRSGDDKRLVMGMDKFLATWQRSGSWGMVTLRPGELPAEPDPVRFLEAVSAFELSGDLVQAHKSYQAAHKAWPLNQTILFAVGNNYLLQRKYREAAAVFRQLLAVDPDHIAAANNLAETLARQGCYAEAYAVVYRTAILARKLNSPLEKAVQRTQREIAENLHQTDKSEARVCHDKP